MRSQLDPLRAQVRPGAPRQKDLKLLYLPHALVVDLIFGGASWRTLENRSCN